MRDAQAGAAQLEEIERRLAPRQHVDEFAREVFAIVGVQVQRLEVVAEVHGAQRGRAAGELRQRDAQIERAEDPVLLRELAAPVVLVLLGQVFQSHQWIPRRNCSNRVLPSYPTTLAGSLPRCSTTMVGNALTAYSDCSLDTGGGFAPVSRCRSTTLTGTNRSLISAASVESRKISSSITWHGPHHSAENSYRIGFFDTSDARAACSMGTHFTRSSDDLTGQRDEIARTMISTTTIIGSHSESPRWFFRSQISVCAIRHLPLAEDETGQEE